ncbi:MAG: ABC transporter permease, partial [Acidimicrobiia bacterium]|nr:ABC transporter permease [Acidimicrobiia bacterium]
MLTNVFTKTTRDRWKGMAVGVASLATLFFFAMSVYRDIDLSVYTNLPEVFRTLMDIPKNADVGSLAYGAIFGSYGTLTIAAVAVSMGSASIAGEERKGTIGLLLGNPKSRVSVLSSKAASLVLLLGLGSLVLWGVGLGSAAILGVETGGMHVGALVFHMFAISVFYGFLAMAIGAWTGSSGMASGVTAGVMFISFVGAGLFPIIKGWENVTKA